MKIYGQILGKYDVFLVFILNVELSKSEKVLASLHTTNRLTNFSWFETC